MACGHVTGSGFDVAGLVIKEKVGFKLTQELTFLQAAQEHGFVHLNVPVHQCANGALVRWRTTGGDKCGANAHVGCARLLQLVQGSEQGFERAGRQRLCRFGFFVLLKRIQPLGLKHALCFVAKEHRVTVKRNAHFVRVGVRGVG